MAPKNQDIRNNAFIYSVELSDIHEGIRGTIYFGISNNRGALIIPKFVPRFQEVFPNIDVQIMLDVLYYKE